MEDVITVGKNQDTICVSPSSHSVSDPERFRRRATTISSEILRISATYLVPCIIFFSLLYFVGWPLTVWIYDWSNLPGGFNNYPYLAKLAIGVAFFLFVGGELAAAAVAIWWGFSGIQDFLSVIHEPSINTPESTLDSFMNYIQSSDYNRAFNLLTDEGRSVGKIQVPALLQSELQERLKQQTGSLETAINDLLSFEIYWKMVNGVIRIKDRSRKIRAGDNFCILRQSFESRNRMNTGLGTLTAEFLLVKKHGGWYVCNGFLVLYR